MTPTPATSTRNPPVALTIAGSDSGGGAGIQADLKTFEALGCFGTSAITAITAQNTTGVKSIQTLDPEIVRDQIDMVVADLKPGAAKTGMLATAALIETVAAAITHHNIPTVVDPVMVATSGARLIAEDAIVTLRKTLLPVARLITPNRMEAEALTGIEIHTLADAERAATRLLEEGAQAVLLKGGHIEETPNIVDLLVTREGVTRHEKRRIRTSNTHGSGCTLAAAIAAGLAKGATLHDAVAEAERLIDYALQNAHQLGRGEGPVQHLAMLRNDAARGATLTGLRDARDQILATPGAARLVAEVGMNIAVATPYAIGPDDVAALEGRITRANTPRGFVPIHAGGVAFGASKHMSRLLLTLREHDPQVRAVMNIRHEAETLQALKDMGWDVVEADRRHEPQDSRAREGSSMDWAARHVMRDRSDAPDAITDPGEPGKEPMIRLIAHDLDMLLAKASELAARVLRSP
jgi:hydroxymethylpyrimidine kinase / phosphomethylpyrimidine kinase / thiamine-phosphate diphosphorylase